MQESSGSIDIKEERKDNPDKNVVVMPVEESTNLLTMPQRIKKSSKLNVRNLCLNGSLLFCGLLFFGYRS